MMIDVASANGARALPPHDAITSEDWKEAIDRQQVGLRPNDVVLIRTGAIQFWQDANQRELLSAHHSARLSLEVASWLVEQNGSMLIDSDTSGLEAWPAEEDVAAHQQKHGMNEYDLLGRIEDADAVMVYHYFRFTHHSIDCLQNCQVIVRPRVA